MRNSTVRRALMGAMLTGGLKPTAATDDKAPTEMDIPHVEHNNLSRAELMLQPHQQVAAEHVTAFAEDLKVLPVGVANVDSVKIQQSGPYGQSLTPLRSLVHLLPKSINGLSTNPDAETVEKVIKNASGSKVVRQANLRNVQTRLSKSKAAKKKVKTSPLMKLLIKQVT